MIRNLRLVAMFLLFALPVRTAEVRLIAPGRISAVLQEGQQAQIVTRGKKVLKGKAIRVSAEGVIFQTNHQETLIPLEDIRRLTITHMRGNKRTRLPIILCSTIGTTSFIAAGGTEEQKSTYLPLTAALTVGIGLGSYYAGRAMDRQEIKYEVKEVIQP